MSAPFLDFLRCGAFIFVPLFLLGGGLWAIVRFVGMDGKLAFLLGAVLMGITFFATALIGMAIDPRATHVNLGFMLGTAGLIGLAAFGATLVFTPILRSLFSLFK